jgi:hypothetical protein
METQGRFDIVVQVQRQSAIKIPSFSGDRQSFLLWPSTYWLRPIHTTENYLTAANVSHSQAPMAHTCNHNYLGG